MASKIRCLFGLHDKKIINVFHYTDTSFNMRIPSTKVTSVCRNCKKVFVQTINFTYKTFTKEELER